MEFTKCLPNKKSKPVSDKNKIDSIAYIYDDRTVFFYLTDTVECDD